MSYKSYERSKLERTITRVEDLFARYAHFPAFYGFEPVNEPHPATSMDYLQEYYRRVRNLLRAYNPSAQFVFHDAGHTGGQFWNDLFDDDDMENVIYDYHPYLAFGAQFETDVMVHCDNYQQALSLAEDVKYPVWAGEWSLATDVCAHWLNGLNDHRDTYTYTCKQVECPKPYLSEDLSPDFDRTAAVLGPFGTNGDDGAAIHSGLCLTDSDYYSD
jgi:glucan 1,3-beta-glucosidase